MFDLKQAITDVADFPRPGILFRDITPLLRDHFDATMQAMDAWQSVSGVSYVLLDADVAPRAKWLHHATDDNRARIVGRSVAPTCSKC